MRIALKETLNFCFLILLLSSCSKDKMLERRLHKNEGEWKITSFSWSLVSQSGNGQLIKNGVTNNAGTFTFDKDGSGKYSYAVDTFQRSGTFKWNVDDQKITITSANQQMSLWGNYKCKAESYFVCRKGV